MRRVCIQILATLFVFTVLINQESIAQCSPLDFSPVRIDSITTSIVTCPQNGKITVHGASGGGNEYVYEIISGPIIRGIQSQNEFAALLPGKYRVRVTGCSGNFYESDTITVANRYIETPMHYMTFVETGSFKCNDNTGKVVIKTSLYMPSGGKLDTLMFSLPLQYQVSTSSDQLTGFNNSSFNNFDSVKYYYGSDKDSRGPRIGGGGGEPSSDSGSQTYLNSMDIYDTLSGLASGTTYYIRVTDACGVFKTNAITIPNITSPNYTYSFAVKEPYKLYSWSTEYPAVKGNCIQWGELAIYQNGTPITSIPSNNTKFPIKAVLKRQDTNEILDTRLFGAGGLSKYTTRSSTSTTSTLTNFNNPIFDSVPRVPVTLVITDQCGTVTTLNVNTSSTLVPFKLQANTQCSSGSSFFYVNTYNASPSLPVRYKLYDASNNLLYSKWLNNASQYIYLKSNNNSGYTYEQSSAIDSFGIYRIVFEDQCGMKDSIEHNFQSGTASVAQPSFTFNPYSPVCSSTDGITRYSVEVIQTGTAPVASIKITSGTANIYYPRTMQSSSYVSTMSNGGTSYNIIRFFDSLPAGTYQVAVQYGCNQNMTTQFTINNGTTGNVTATLAFTVQNNDCSNIGSAVRADARITSTNTNFVKNDLPFIRITNAPIGFLLSLSRSKNGSLPALPFNLGSLGAISYSENGIDTNTVNVYPTLTFMSISGGYFAYPPGNYSFEIYGKCSGRILASASFVTTGVPYSTPYLGASSGYICDGGNPKVIVSPIGGKRNYNYQIKLASLPGETGYSALQTDSVFVLPSSTPPGTVYTIRAIDACNNAFVGQVVVNSFTGNLYIASTNDCVGRPAKIFTGYIPGATYTWTKPNGTTVISNSNELYFPELQITDIGQYTVMVDALGGCISRGAGSNIGNRCYRVLPVNFLQFTATKANEALVNLSWKVNTAINVKSYIVEVSEDAEKWNTLETFAAKTGQTGGEQVYTSLHHISGTNTKQLLYYRIKAVDNNGQLKYSEVRVIYFSTEFSLEKVYPNPFKDMVNFDLMSDASGQALIQLHDLSGREVSRSIMPVKKGINKYQYKPVLQINAGRYVLSISQGSKKVIYQVIKM